VNGVLFNGTRNDSPFLGNLLRRYSFRATQIVGCSVFRGGGSLPTPAWKPACEWAPSHLLDCILD